MNDVKCPIGRCEQRFTGSPAGLATHLRGVHQSPALSAEVLERLGIAICPHAACSKIFVARGMGTHRAKCPHRPRAGDLAPVASGVLPATEQTALGGNLPPPRRVGLEGEPSTLSSVITPGFVQVAKLVVGRGGVLAEGLPDPVLGTDLSTSQAHTPLCDAHPQAPDLVNGPNGGVGPLGSLPDPGVVSSQTSVPGAPGPTIAAAAVVTDGCAPLAAGMGSGSASRSSERPPTSEYWLGPVPLPVASQTSALVSSGPTTLPASAFDGVMPDVRPVFGGGGAPGYDSSLVACQTAALATLGPTNFPGLAYDGVMSDVTLPVLGGGVGFGPLCQTSALDAPGVTSDSVWSAGVTTDDPSTLVGGPGLLSSARSLPVMTPLSPLGQLSVHSCPPVLLGDWAYGSPGVSLMDGLSCPSPLGPRPGVIAPVPGDTGPQGVLGSPAIVGSSDVGEPPIPFLPPPVMWSPGGLHGEGGFGGSPWMEDSDVSDLSSSAQFRDRFAGERLDQQVLLPPPVALGSPLLGHSRPMHDLASSASVGAPLQLGAHGDWIVGPVPHEDGVVGPPLVAGSEVVDTLQPVGHQAALDGNVVAPVLQVDQSAVAPISTRLSDPVELLEGDTPERSTSTADVQSGGEAGLGVPVPVQSVAPANVVPIEARLATPGGSAWISSMLHSTPEARQSVAGLVRACEACADCPSDLSGALRDVESSTPSLPSLPVAALEDWLRRYGLTLENTPACCTTLRVITALLRYHIGNIDGAERSDDVRGDLDAHGQPPPWTTRLDAGQAHLLSSRQLKRLKEMHPKAWGLVQGFIMDVCSGPTAHGDDLVDSFSASVGSHDASSAREDASRRRRLVRAVAQSGYHTPQRVPPVPRSPPPRSHERRVYVVDSSVAGRAVLRQGDRAVLGGCDSADVAQEGGVADEGMGDQSADTDPDYSPSSSSMDVSSGTSSPASDDDAPSPPGAGPPDGGGEDSDGSGSQPHRGDGDGAGDGSHGGSEGHGPAGASGAASDPLSMALHVRPPSRDIHEVVMRSVDGRTLAYTRPRAGGPMGGRFLLQNGLDAVELGGSGNCFFLAVCYSVLGDSSLHRQLRARVSEHMAANKGSYFPEALFEANLRREGTAVPPFACSDDFLAALHDGNEWASSPVVRATADYLHVNFRLLVDDMDNICVVHSMYPQVHIPDVPYYIAKYSDMGGHFVALRVPLAHDLDVPWDEEVDTDRLEALLADLCSVGKLVDGRGRLWTHVPDKAKRLFVRMCERLLVMYARASRQGSQLGMAFAIAMLIWLPRRALSKFRGGRRRAVNSLVSRLRHYTDVLSMDEDPLAPVTAAGPPPPGFESLEGDDTARPPQRPKRSPADAQALDLVVRGFLHRAAMCLRRDEAGLLSPSDPAVWEHVVRAHPRFRDDLGHMPPPPDDEPVPLVLDDEGLTDLVHKANKGAAAGLSGMTMDMLVPLMDSQACREGLIAFIADMAAGRICNPLARGLLLAGRLVLPPKKRGLQVPRPITIHETLVNLVTDAVYARIPESLATDMQPFQMGIRTPAGVEAAFSFADLAVKSMVPGDGKCLVWLDMHNGFNAISRARILKDALDEPRLESARHFIYFLYHSPHALYAVEGGDVAREITSEEGVCQGHKLSSLLFGYSMHRSYKGSVEGLDGASMTAIMDDAIYAGDLDSSLTAVERLVAAMPGLGLDPDVVDKRWIILSSPPSPAAQARIEALGLHVVDASVDLLGGFVGRDQEAVARDAAAYIDARAAQLDKLVDSALPVQMKFLLLRCCLHPSLAFFTRITPSTVCRDALVRYDARVQLVLKKLLSVKRPLPLSAQIQSSLPLRMGGLALRQLVDTADMSRLASFSQTLEIALPLLGCSQHGPFPAPLVDEVTHLIPRIKQLHAVDEKVTGVIGDLSSVQALLTRFATSALPAGTLSLQKLLQASHDKHVLEGLIQLCDRGPRPLQDKVRISAASARGAAAWLVAVPIESLPYMAMTDLDFRLALLYLMGLDPFEMQARHRSTCPLCGRPSTAGMAAHFLSCMSVVPLTKGDRHDPMRDLLLSVASTVAGLYVKPEPLMPNGTALDGQVTMVTAPETYFDISIVCPEAPSYIMAAAGGPIAATRPREMVKRQKYEPLFNDPHPDNPLADAEFVPVVYTAHGGVCDAGRRFIKDLAFEASDYRGDLQPYSSGLQAYGTVAALMSVALQKGNARVLSRARQLMAHRGILARSTIARGRRGRPRGVAPTAPRALVGEGPTGF
ncbi:MAG: hypothetical protein GY832_19750 [Chloroflexi bacterium]|nr:hypothetical protein [Chloroflexota bacterium]